MKNKHKIVRRKLSDEVFKRLVEMIGSGGLKQGDKLPSERELMDDFGVGRPSVREAMQSLEKMGLITIRHGDRARVAKPSAERVIEQIDIPVRLFLSATTENLEDLKEARLVLERSLVRIAAQKATPEDIERLKQCLARQKTAAVDNDSAAFIQADMDMHESIAAISGNRIFEAVIHSMLGWCSTFHESIIHWEGREQFTIEEHEKIIELIADHDPEGAITALTDHLNRTRKFYSRKNLHQNGEVKPTTPTK